MRRLDVTLQRAAAFSLPKDIEFDDIDLNCHEAGGRGGAPDHRQGQSLGGQCETDSGLLPRRGHFQQVHRNIETYATFSSSHI